MNALETRDLIHSINTREKSIEELSKHATSSASNWLNEVALQGSDLIKLKAATPHGDWEKLFISGSIKCSVRTAQRYMRYASRVSLLKDATSLRQAIVLLADEPTEQSTEPPQRWPDFQEAISRVSRFAGFIEKRNMDKWPREGLDRLRELLLPINLKLFPDKFAGHIPSHD